MAGRTELIHQMIAYSILRQAGVPLGRFSLNLAAPTLQLDAATL